MIGQALRRSEDVRLLTGRGRFTDDVNLPDQLYAVFVRSPHAHADLAAIDAAPAARSPGVAGVFTGKDLAEGGVGPIPTLIAERGVGLRNREGSAVSESVWMPIAADRVRYVGEVVAIVVAETPSQAQDAAERLAVDYAPRPAVVRGPDATADGAPLLHAGVARNRVWDCEAGDRAATDAAFEAAAHVVRLEVPYNRLVANPIEARAAIASWDPDDGRCTLIATTQGVHQQAQRLAQIFGAPVERFRVVSDDVGGGFGAKSPPYPEYAALVWASRRLGRPVKWTGTRAEGFLSDLQSRDHVTRAQLALDKDGGFLGLRVRSVANMGAYVSAGAPASTAANMARMVAGVYATPAIHFVCEGVLTNKTPVGVYRGVGRLEAVYILERLIDRAARELGMDRAALRRRNMVRPEQMPYTTPTGAVYDSGDYARHLETAMARSGWATFPERREESRRRGRLRGIGIGCYIEGAGGLPNEYAKVSVGADGRIVVPVGSHSQGQAHETTFAQVVAERLGVDFAHVDIVMGDTDRVARGLGTFASRSMVRAGAAMADAVELLIEQGKSAAGHMLEAAASDIVYDRGVFSVAGTDRSVGLFDIALAVEGGDLPRAFGEEFAAESWHENAAFAFPNGCEICELEVDPETGAVEILRFTITDDCGRAVNPMIVEGQAHGATVQGIGQALMEACVHDPESGQLLGGSLVDYALPRADDIPSFDFTSLDFPSPTNVLGVKGAGEGGTVGAPPAVVNALLDALGPLGVTDIDMPATPCNVWRAIRQARAAPD